MYLDSLKMPSAALGALTLALAGVALLGGPAAAAGTLTVSLGAPAIEAGSTTTITVEQSSDQTFPATRFTYDSNVVQVGVAEAAACTTVEPGATSCFLAEGTTTLTVSTVNVGTTAIVVELLNDDGVVAASQTMDVEVVSPPVDPGEPGEPTEPVEFEPNASRCEYEDSWPKLAALTGTVVGSPEFDGVLIGLFCDEDLRITASSPVSTVEPGDEVEVTFQVTAPTVRASTQVRITEITGFEIVSASQPYRAETDEYELWMGGSVEPYHEVTLTLRALESEVYSISAIWRVGKGKTWSWTPNGASVTFAPATPEPAPEQPAGLAPTGGEIDAAVAVAVAAGLSALAGTAALVLAARQRRRS